MAEFYSKEHEQRLGREDKLHRDLRPNLGDSDCHPDVSNLGTDYVENDDDTLAPFMDKLRDVWIQCNRCRALSCLLQDYFVQQSNPYATTLAIIRRCPDYRQNKTVNLTQAVIEELELYLKYHNGQELLTTSLQKEAFQVASRQKNRQLTKSIVDVYQLNKSRSLFIESLKAFLRLKMYKEVCEWTMLLNLQDQFNIFDFLVPLLLQDRLTVVNEFLVQAPDHHLALVKFLDDLLAQDSVELAFNLNSLISELEIADIKRNTLTKFLNVKSLAKYLKKILTIHKVSREFTPNFYQNSSLHTVYFLLHKRYTNGDLGKEGFRELVADALGDNREIQIKFINRLYESFDHKEGCYWIKKYNITPAELPIIIADYYRHQLEYLDKDPDWLQDDINIEMEHEPGPSGRSNASSIATETKYHQLNLPQSCIYLVDTEKKLVRLIERCSTFKEQEVVGIDAEWKPTMVTSTTEISLLQLSTSKEIYLIDIISLSRYTDLWKQFNQEFFKNPSILKLGFSLKTDLSKLSHTLHLDGLESMKYVDLYSLWNKLVKEYHYRFPYQAQQRKSSSGLSQLVELCFGRPLDKTEQFSNWEMRPLRISQIIYAALDAFCLVEIFSVIKRTPNDIPINDIVRSMVNSGSKKWRNLRMGRKQDNGHSIQPKENLDMEVGVGWLRLACEHQLEQFVREIRRAGVDAVIEDSVQSLLSKAIRDNRIVVLTENTFNKIADKVTLKKYYKVESNNCEAQVIGILNHYNVRVLPSNVNSRCQACNSTDIIAVQTKQISDCLKTRTQSTDHTSSTNNTHGVPSFDDANISVWDNEEDEWDVVTSPNSLKSQFTKCGIGDEKLYTGIGAEIKLEEIPQQLLQSSSTVPVCNQCGESTWNKGYFSLLCK